MRAEREELVSMGQRLRALIRENKSATGRSYRHLSEAINREATYIASFLNKDAHTWALPKHPTLGLLLNELGKSEADLASKESKHSFGLSGEAQDV